jgi:hypothetical protein
MEYVLPAAILGRVCHSRMLLAGIQAEFGWTPIKTLGGDDLGESYLFTSAAVFGGVSDIE